MSKTDFEIHSSACPLDCPDSCSLSVQVEEGRVTLVDGNDRNPVTQGYICAKVRRLPEALYGEDRLLAPAIREGEKGEGRFRTVSWEEALDRIADRLAAVREESGGEAILPFSYGGSNGLLSQDTTDARLFGRLGASQLARTVCAAPTGRAAQGLYGKMPGVAHPDYVHARLIVIWGANPSASGIHLVPFIQEAKKNGAKVVVVDPRRTKPARRADLHLAPRAGTDLPLALSLIRWLLRNDSVDRDFLDRHVTGLEELERRADPWTFERAGEVCGLAPKQLETFARLYAETSPAVIRCGWGLERNRNGGSAVAAVLALPALAGKFGVRGGGYTMSNSAAWGLDSRVGANVPEPTTRTVNMNELGQALTGSLEPPIRTLFVYNCNPLMTMPNQSLVETGLRREDLFTVVFDPFLTDTAKYADVLLPAASFLERRELVNSYGSFALQQAEPVVAPVGESRTNHEVFLELCQTFGAGRAGRSAVRRGDRDRDPRTSLSDAARATLKEDGLAHPPYGPTPVQFVDVFPGTEDGKVHLVPADLDAEAPEGLYAFLPDPATADFPLTLLSPATSRTISSSLGQLHRQTVPVELHPKEARDRGLRSGDRVRVWNRFGEVHTTLRINTELIPGLAVLPKGLWSHNTLNGNTANVLAPDSLTDLGGGACFNDARVQVEPLEETSK